MESEASLLWGIIFGAIGFGFLSYGRKQRKLVPALTGGGLIALPYLSSSVGLMFGLAAILVGASYYLRY